MYKILDTNILLLDAHNLINLAQDGSIIVLPETTLDEIDSKKSGHSEIAFQAREFGRLLTKATRGGTETFEDITATILHLDDVVIHVATTSTYPDLSNMDPKIHNDRKIIEIAIQYWNSFPDSVFVSNDVMCRIRAESLNIPVTDLKNVETTDLEFTRTVQLDSDTFSTLRYKPILDIVPDHKPENFNYQFIDTFSGQMKLANISNGLIEILGKDTENELAKQDATPMNAGQKFLSKAIQSQYTDVIVCEALAGSGKTVTALSNAVQLIKRGQYNSIVYIRASVDDVDKAEEIGFLSGNDEKMQVYLHPLDDTIDFLVRSNHKASKLKGNEFEDMIAEKVAEYKAKYRISGIIGLGLRGRTFTDTVAIIDEAQNMSKSSLQKVLTRFGKNCKVIIVGSNRQIDNPYITKYTNGLSVVLDAARKKDDNIRMHVVPLNKVLRSNIAEWAENTFSSKGQP